MATHLIARVPMASHALPRPLSQAVLRAVFDQTADAVIVTDDAGLCVDANAAAYTLLAARRDEVVGRHAGRFLLAEDESESRVVWEELALGSRPPGTVRLVGTRGEHRGYLRAFVPGAGLHILLASAGEPTAGLERQPAETADATGGESELEEFDSEQRFLRLAERVRAVFWIYDREGARFTYISSAFEDVVGRPVGVLLNDPSQLQTIIHAADRSRVLELLRTSQPTNDDGLLFRIVLPNGALRWIRARAFPGPGRSLFGLSLDVTRLLETADAIRSARAELEARVAERTSQLMRMNRGLEDEVARRTAAEQARAQLLVRLVNAQETERRHIARGLHDDVGQTLTALKLHLLAMERSSGDGGLQTADAVEIVDQILEQVRTLAIDLRPSLLDDLGLVEALRWYVDRVAQKAGIQVVFTTVEFAKRVPPDAETALFRIAQEAVTNVVRHSKARFLWVTLRLRRGEATMAVLDDGVGFDAQAALGAASRGGSLGLLGIQERVAAAGGSLSITSKPGRGTRLTVRVPVPSTERQWGHD